jgi:hypothetical protein
MSRESIMKELDYDFIRKMRNWLNARNGPSYAMSSVYDGMREDRYHEARMPRLYGEAADIDYCMRKVAMPEREAVHLFWAKEDWSMRRLGRELGGREPRTAEAWVRQGHRLLQRELVLHVKRCRDYSSDAYIMTQSA